MTKQKNSNADTVKSQSNDIEKNFAQKPLTDKIGNSLKQMYDDVVNQPVPDDFLSLLIEADKKSE